MIVARASHCDEHQFRAKMTVSILEPFFEISSLKIVVLANKNEKMALSLLHTFAFSCLSDSDICSPEIPKILGHALVSGVDIQHSQAIFRRQFSLYTMDQSLLSCDEVCYGQEHYRL